MCTLYTYVFAKLSKLSSTFYASSRAVYGHCSFILFFRYAHTPGGKPSNANQTFLDESGFSFVQDCLAGLENRGLEDQGMYRVVGVGSKVIIERRVVT